MRKYDKPIIPLPEMLAEKVVVVASDMGMYIKDFLASMEIDYQMYRNHITGKSPVSPKYIEKYKRIVEHFNSLQS